jgi:transcriptional regulator with XRE-family HTH domain
MPKAKTRGQRLAAILTARKLGKTELAKRMGSNSSMVCHILSGKHVPTLEWLTRAALAIPCNPHDLDPALVDRPVEK